MADSNDEDLELIRELLQPNADPLRVMAFAYAQAMSRLREAYDVMKNPPAPTEMRCAWCAIAAGNTAETWRNAIRRAPEDAAAHAVSCSNNPLVVKARNMVNAFAADVRCDEACNTTMDAWKSLKDAVCP